HTHERVREDLEIGARVHADEAAGDHAGQGRQRRAEGEDGHRDQEHVDPHAAGHLRIIDSRPDHRADARALERQPEHEGNEQGDGDNEDPIDREGELPDHVRSREQRRHRDRVGIATPEHERQVLEDEGEAHRGQHLPQLLAAQPLEERVPLGDADERDGQGTDQHGEDEAAAAPDRREGDVAAEQVVRAVRHVDDAHHAEDEREPPRQEKEEGAVRHAIEELTDPEVHDGARLYYRRGIADHRRRAVRLPHERFDYSPIAARRPWTLPRRARLAVWTIVNVEEWDIEKPMPRGVLSAPQGVTTVPDVPNWAWHDYGMRVGFWRMLEALTRRKIRATTAINANVCRSYEPVARGMMDAGWEFMGHGVKQGAMHLIPDQRDAIRTAIRLLSDFTGKKPKGWLGPGLTETWETLDLLAEEGIEYVSDWVNDDQPYEIRTSHGPLVSVPYTLELNDIPMMVIQHHESSAWLARCRDPVHRPLPQAAQRRRGVG